MHTLLRARTVRARVHARRARVRVHVRGPLGRVHVPFGVDFEAILEALGPRSAQEHPRERR